MGHEECVKPSWLNPADLVFGRVTTSVHARVRLPRPQPYGGEAEAIAQLRCSHRCQEPTTELQKLGGVLKGSVVLAFLLVHVQVGLPWRQPVLKRYKHLISRHMERQVRCQGNVDAGFWAQKVCETNEFFEPMPGQTSPSTPALHRKAPKRV